MVLSEYLKRIEPTDRLAKDDIKPVLMGLFGEVGGIMTSAKKLKREGTAYIGFRSTVEEEFGDTLWYLAALARRYGIDLAKVFQDVAATDKYEKVVAAGRFENAPLMLISSPVGIFSHDESLLSLAQASSVFLVTKDNNKEEVEKNVQNFVEIYLNAVIAVKLSFASIIDHNLKKVEGRFLKPDFSSLPRFDDNYDDDERLPDNFEIVIRQRNDKAFLSWNGVFVGAPLTDNIAEGDEYRFHDVFHLAHAAVLHWSPTFRSLIQHKRKSNRVIDETQDGGRSIVVEEGLTAWLYTRAKQLNLFENQDAVSFDILKTIAEFVSGYEVAQCPLSLWESAILQGYAVFRQVVSNNGGKIIGDRVARTIRYESHIK